MSEPCPTPKKISYRKRWEAERVLGRIWRKGVKGGGKLPTCVYKCRCGHWHLTSQPRRRDSRRAA